LSRRAVETRFIVIVTGHGYCRERMKTRHTFEIPTPVIELRTSSFYTLNFIGIRKVPSTVISFITIGHDTIQIGLSITYGRHKNKFETSIIMVIRIHFRINITNYNALLLVC